MSELLSFVLSQEDQFRRQRLPSLYADFTLQRNSNPDGYAANTSAWINALAKAAQAGLVPVDGGDRDTFSLQTGNSLIQCLETKEWGRPLALGAVIDEAVSQRRFIPYAQYLAARKSIYNNGFAVQPWWLLSWGLRQLGLSEPFSRAGTLPAGRFVILQNIEEAAVKIMKQMEGKSNQTDRIHPLSFFRAEIGTILEIRPGVTDSDLHIILTYLGRDKSAIIYDSQTVKFKSPGDTSVTLSEQDRTVSSLKSLIADISVQVAHLSKRIDALSETAQIAIVKKNRSSALSALRSKKLNETILSQRSDTLSQLEEVYSRVEQAADQVTVVRVMKDSTALLRNLYAEVGGVDAVEDVVEGLQDEMSKVDEISSALEAGGQQDTVVDESAVDEELKAMERQAKLEEDERKALETQNRLASIDEVNEVAKAKAPQRQTLTEKGNTPFDEDNKALRRLSLDDGTAAPVEEGVPQLAAGRVQDVVLGS